MWCCLAFKVGESTSGLVAVVCIGSSLNISQSNVILGRNGWLRRDTVADRRYWYPDFLESWALSSRPLSKWSQQELSSLKICLEIWKYWRPGQEREFAAFVSVPQTHFPCLNHHNVILNRRNPPLKSSSKYRASWRLAQHRIWYYMTIVKPRRSLQCSAESNSRMEWTVIVHGTLAPEVTERTRYHASPIVYIFNNI